MKFSTDINKLFENFSEESWGNGETDSTDNMFDNTLQSEVRKFFGDITYVKINGSTIPVLMSGKEVAKGLDIGVQIEGETLAIFIDCDKSYDDAMNFLSKSVSTPNYNSVMNYIMNNVEDDFFDNNVNYLTISIKTKKGTKAFEFGRDIKSFVLCIKIDKIKASVPETLEPTQETQKQWLFRNYFYEIFNLMAGHNLGHIMSLATTTELSLTDDSDNERHFYDKFQRSIYFVMNGQLSSDSGSKLYLSISQNVSEMTVHEIERFAEFFGMGDFKAEYDGSYIKNNIKIFCSKAGKHIQRLNDLNVTIKGDVSFVNGIDIDNFIYSTNNSMASARVKLDLSGCHSSGVFIIQGNNNNDSGSNVTFYKRIGKMSSFTIVLPHGTSIPVLGFQSSIGLLLNPYFKLVGSDTNLSFLKFMTWNDMNSMDILSNMEELFPRFTRHLNPNLIDKVFFTLPPTTAHVSALGYPDANVNLKILLDDINLHPDYDFKDKIAISSYS